MINNTAAIDIPLKTLTGASILGYIARKMVQDKEKEKEMMNEKNLVDTEKYVAKYAPEVTPITSRKDVDKIKDIGFINRLIVNRMIPKENNPWKAYNHFETDQGGFIAAPPMANKYILGHEIGHNIDSKTNPITPLDELKMLVGVSSGMEERAWDKSPAGRNEDTDYLQSSYDMTNKYLKLGAALGLSIGLGKHFGPRVLEMIRGNIR